MKIEYTYSVDNQDLENKLMHVSYSSPGLKTFTKIIPLTETMSLVDGLLGAIKLNAPLAEWQFEQKEVQSVDTNLTGTISADVTAFYSKPAELVEQPVIAEIPVQEL